MHTIEIIEMEEPKLDRDEQRAMLQKMRSASAAFYGDAVHTGVHAFIEFCGLMNEFIKICEESAREGIDFSQANVHSGQTLKMQPHHVRYLSEKLECIYGATLRSNPELQMIFLQNFLPEVAAQVRRKR